MLCRTVTVMKIYRHIAGILLLLLQCSPTMALDEYLIVADGGEGRANLYEISVNTGDVRAILPSRVADFSSPLALTVDQESGTVYWTDTRFVSISRYRDKSASQHTELNSSKYSVIYNNTLDETPLECLTLDKSTQTLYFCHIENDRGIIGKIQTDGRNKETILSRADLKPQAIVIDTQNRQLYWADVGANPGIYRVSLSDPSSYVTIASEDIQKPNGLAIDFIEGSVYWADAGLSQIQKCKLDGSGRRNLVQGSGDSYFGLTVSSQFIFYTDWNQQLVRRAGRDGGGLKSLQRPILSMPNGIVCLSKVTDSLGRLRVMNILEPPEPSSPPTPLALIMPRSSQTGAATVTLASSTGHIRRSTATNTDSIINTTPSALTLVDQSTSTFDVKLIIILAIGGLLFIVIAALIFILLRKKFRWLKTAVGGEPEHEMEGNVYEYIPRYEAENSRNEMSATLSRNNNGTALFQNGKQPASRNGDSMYIKPLPTQVEEDEYLNPVAPENEYCALNCGDTKDYTEYSQIL